MTAIEILRAIQSKITRVDKVRGGRHYQVEGYPDPFPSVTTILNAVVAKSGLVPWARDVALEDVKQAFQRRMTADAGYLSDEPIDWSWVEAIIEEARRRPEEVRVQATDFGTRSHALINDFLLGKEPHIPEDLEQVFQGFLSWQDENSLNLVAGEMMVYHRVLHYAGSIDAIGERDGQIVVLDWKTGKAIYPEHFLQVAAYWLALRDMAPPRTYLSTDAWVVRFGKTALSFEAVRVPDLIVAMDGFRDALGLYRALERLKVPQRKEAK